MSAWELLTIVFAIGMELGIVFSKEHNISKAIDRMARMQESDSSKHAMMRFALSLMFGFIAVMYMIYSFRWALQYTGTIQWCGIIILALSAGSLAVHVAHGKKPAFISVLDSLVCVGCLGTIAVLRIPLV